MFNLQPSDPVQRTRSADSLLHSDLIPANDRSEVAGVETEAGGVRASRLSGERFAHLASGRQDGDDGDS